MAKKPAKQTASSHNGDAIRAGSQLQADLLRLINEAATQIQRSARSEEAVFKAVEEQITSLGFVGGVCMVDDIGDSLVVRGLATSKPTRAALSALEVVAGLSAVGISFPIAKVDVYSQLFERGQSVFEEDNNATVLQAIPDSLQPLATKVSGMFGHMPTIFAPLRAGTKVIGGLNISGDGLTPELVPTIEVLANHVTIALENARLYTETKRAEELLLERTTDLALINELSEALNRGDELDTVFQRLEYRLRDIFGVSSTMVWLGSRDGDRLRLRYADRSRNIVHTLESLTGLDSREISVPIDPEGTLARSGAADESIDLLGKQSFIELLEKGTDARWQASPVGQQIREAISAVRDLEVQAIPFSMERKPVGFLACTHRKPITRKATQRLKHIARQLAPAIRQRQDRQALARSLDELQLLDGIRRMTMDGAPFEIVLDSVGAAIWQLSNVRAVTLLLHDAQDIRDAGPRPSLEETTIDQLADLHDVEILRCGLGSGNRSRRIHSLPGGEALILTGAEIDEQTRLLAPDDPLLTVLSDANSGADPHTCVALIRLASVDGPMGWLAMVFQSPPTTTDQERVVRLAGLIASLIGRLRVIREREATRSLLKTAIDCGPDALVVIDTDYRRGVDG